MSSLYLLSAEPAGAEERYTLSRGPLDVRKLVEKRRTGLAVLAMRAVPLVVSVLAERNAALLETAWLGVAPANNATTRTEMMRKRFTVPSSASLALALQAAVCHEFSRLRGLSHRHSRSKLPRPCRSTTRSASRSR